MDNTVNITQGKFGLKESLVAIRQKEVDKVKKQLALIEENIQTKNEQVTTMDTTSNDEVARIEKEYTIRLRNNEREHEELVKSVEKAKADLEFAKDELQKCSFLAVSRKKTLTEDVEALEEKYRKLSNNLRVNETTGKELLYARDKHMSKHESGSGKIKESLEEDMKDADSLKEVLAKKQKELDNYEAMSIDEVIRLYKSNQTLREYIGYILSESEGGLSFTDIQSKNPIFDAISDVRVSSVIREMLEEKIIKRSMEGEAALFSIA